MLYVNGFSPAILYGLAKVHKANIPLRPILAAFKTASYRLAKFIIPAFDDLIQNGFTLKNTYDFKQFIDNYSFNQNVFLASFDITSLFTNVPIKETIDIATRWIYDQGGSYKNMSRNEFKRCLELCTLDNHFLFNGKHYVQHEGFAMGNPVSATMANLFLAYHERNWLENCPVSFKPILYKRYVDDCFLAFKRRDHAELFLNYLNQQHRNIKFTMEEEENNKINFLDCTLTKSENGNTTSIIFNVFRKLTFTGLGMNFQSHTFFNFKINNIKTLLHRAFLITSTWEGFTKEVDFLSKFFVNNGYPKNMVWNAVRKFLNKRFSSVSIATVAKMPLYHKIPFMNNYVL